MVNLIVLEVSTTVLAVDVLGSVDFGSTTDVFGTKSFVFAEVVVLAAAYFWGSADVWT